MATANADVGEQIAGSIIVAAGATDTTRANKKGASYRIDAAQGHDFRLPANSTIEFGDYTTIYLVGNVSHSKILGLIRCKHITFVIVNQTGERGDPSGVTCGIEGEEVTYWVLGSGAAPIHQEDDSNRMTVTKRNFYIEQDGGGSSVQFNNKEQLNIFIIDKNSSGTLSIYPSRSHQDGCVLSNFKRDGGTRPLNIDMGANSLGNGYIDNPEFIGVAGNLPVINVTSTEIAWGIKFLMIRFPLDVAEFVNSGGYHARVSTTGGTVLFNGELNAANTTPTLDGGRGTVLEAWDNRSVLLIEASKRTGSDGVMPAYNRINIEIGKYGRSRINLNNVLLNEEILVKDTSTQVTAIPKATVLAYTETETGPKFHAGLSLMAENNWDIDPNIFTWDGKVEDIGAYNLIIDPSATSPVPVLNGNTITAKVATAFQHALRTTGTITLLGGVTITGGYSDSTRDSRVTIIGVDLTKSGNELYYHTSQTRPADNDTNWVRMSSNVYDYLSGATKVWFKYVEGYNADGSPKYLIDDYSLAASGLSNQFSGFASETGVQIQAQTNTLLTELGIIKANQQSIQTSSDGAKSAAEDSQTKLEDNTTGLVAVSNGITIANNNIIDTRTGVQSIASRDYEHPIAMVVVEGTGLIETEGIAGEYLPAERANISFDRLYNFTQGQGNVAPTIDPTRPIFKNENGWYIWAVAKSAAGANDGTYRITKLTGRMGNILGAGGSYFVEEDTQNGAREESNSIVTSNNIRKLRRISQSLTFNGVTTNNYVNVADSEYSITAIKGIYPSDVITAARNAGLDLNRFPVKSGTTS